MSRSGRVVSLPLKRHQRDNLDPGPVDAGLPVEVAISKPIGPADVAGQPTRR
jgi:hypothetical protein